MLIFTLRDLELLKLHILPYDNLFVLYKVGFPGQHKVLFGDLCGRSTETLVNSCWI